MPAVDRSWTVEEVRALPYDGKRYEVIDGELLVTPSPRMIHQDAVLEIARRLADYLDREPVGHVFVAPADIVFADRTLVQPDVFVVPFVEGRKPKSWSEIRTLLLAAEILSPATARADRTLKRRLYQREGVGEYWVVDLHARLVERWRPEDERPQIVTEELEWIPPGAAEPLQIDLGTLFARVHGAP